MPNAIKVCVRDPQKAMRVLCVEPAQPSVVQYRDEAGAWEAVEAVPVSEGYTLRFVAANRFLCLTPDGQLETRESAGLWETFRIAEQPPDWKTVLCFRQDGPRPAGILVVERL